MRRRRGCRAGLLAILIVLLAGLVFGGLTAGLVWVGDLPIHAPRVVGVEPAAGQPVLPTTAFTLTFDQPMNRETVSEAFAILPAVPGSLEWNAGGDQVTFVPADTGFEPGTGYTLHLYGDARSATLQRPLAHELSHSFALPALLIESAPAPGAGDLGAYPELRAEFAYDLDCTSTPQAFFINPSANGQLDCQGHTLVFRPSEPLAPETTYQAGLAHTFLAGDPQPRSGVSWAFQTAPGLSVTDLLPKPGRLLVDLNEPVRITFSRTVKRESAAAQLTVLSAAGEAVAGRIAWEDGGSVLVFHPNAPWLPGSKYVIKLQREVGDELGFTLPQPVEEEFGTLPMIKLPEPAPGTEDVPLDTVISIPFTRAMDRAAVEAGLTVTPALDAAYAWDGDTLLVTPRGGLAASTHYTLSIAADARDATGAPLGSVHRWDLYTQPFLLETRVPTDAPLFSLGTAMTLTFALPMDPLSVRSGLTISPRTPVELSWSEDRRTLVLEPESGWQPGVEYQIRLWGRALTAGRREMGADQVWPFVTAPSEIHLGMGPNVQVLPVVGERTFQALHRGADAIDWRLYAITAAQLVKLYNHGREDLVAQKPALFEPSGLGAATRSWRQEVAMSAIDWQPITVTLPSDVRPGFYVVAAGSGSAVEPVPGLLIAVTDHVLTVKRAPRWQVSTAMAPVTAPVTTTPTATVTTPVTTTLTATVTTPVTTTPTVMEGAARPTQLVIWDTERASGAPVVSATIQVVGSDGGPLAEGVTDGQGLLEIELPGGAEPLFVLSDHRGDVALLGLDPAWSSEPDWAIGPPPANYTVATWTDAEMAHPGATVRFKTMVRAGVPPAYALPPEGTAVSVSLVDAQGEVAAGQVVTTTALGTASGALDLPGSSVPGTWHLVTEVAGERTLTPLQVQPAAAAGTRVAVHTGQSIYVAGEQVTVTVSAVDELGEPIAGAPVELSVHMAYTATGIAAGAVHLEPAIATQTGTTGADGRWTAGLPSTPFAQVDNDRLFALAATVRPAGGPEAAGYELLLVRPAAYRAELLLDRAGYAPGEPMTITARILDRDGRPASAVPLTITLADETGQVVGTANGESGSDGLARFSVAVDEQGWYEVRATVTDEAGHQVQDRAWIWVVDPAGEAPWRGGEEPGPARLSITPDRPGYAAGETVRLAVRAPVAGPALLTVERDRVRAVTPIQLEAGTTVITLPVQAGDEPNVYVALTEWANSMPEAAGTGTPRGYSLQTATTELLVPADGQQLGVTLTPGAESYAPGDEATVHVRVVDAQGAPVTAELSLSVSEALLPSPTVETTGLFTAFFGRQPNQVGTVHSLAPERQLVAQAPAVPEGGMGTPASLVLTRTPHDALYWAPALLTDASGQVSVTLTLPDEPGEWQIVARAVTSDTQIGAAAARLVATEALSVRPLLPTLLVQGDVLTVTALVHNYQPLPVSATVRLDATGLAVSGSPSARQQTIHLPAHGFGRVGWQAAAAEAGLAEIALEATATYRAARLAGRDMARGQVEIQPLVLPTAAAFAGQVDLASPETVLTFTVPANTLELARVDLFLAPSLAQVVQTGVDALATDPYYDVASAAGRLVAAVAARRVTNQTTNFPLALATDSTQALYDAQNEDGGWGRWQSDATSNLTSTTQALFALAMANQAGETIDAERVARGMNGLASLPVKPKPDAGAWARYVLFLAGWPTTPTLTLTEARGLSPFSQAAVALDYDAAGLADRAQPILEALAEAAQQEGETIYWGSGDAGSAPSVSGTAMAVHALARLAPDSDLIPGAARWLVGQRTGDGWGSPWETGLALLALSDVSPALDADDEPGAYQVYVNEVLWREGTLPADRREHLVLTYTEALSPALLVAGDNVLRLVLDGGSSVYYTGRVITTVDAATIAEPFEAAGMPAIGRSYHLPGTDQALEAIPVGELVEVRIWLDVPAESWYAVVHDRLPAGLSVLGEAQVEWLPPDGAPQMVAASGEIQAGAMTFYLTHLGPGVHRISYLARAETEGRFIAPPAVSSLLRGGSGLSHSGTTRLLITAALE